MKEDEGACQKTFSPELVNSLCASSCFTALNAGAGLAWPLQEAANSSDTYNCVCTGGGVSGRSWIALHVFAVSVVAVCGACSHTACAHGMSRSSCTLDEWWPSSRNTDWKMSEFVLVYCLSVQKMAA